MEKKYATVRDFPVNMILERTLSFIFGYNKMMTVTELRCMSNKKETTLFYYALIALETQRSAFYNEKKNRAIRTSCTGFPLFHLFVIHHNFSLLGGTSIQLNFYPYLENPT